MKANLRKAFKQFRQTLTRSPGSQEALPPVDERPRVFVMTPNTGAITPYTVRSYFSTGKDVAAIVEPGTPNSLLGKSFNELWVLFLHSRGMLKLAAGAMIHSDIGAEMGWLSKMWTIMNRVNADFLSVVVPIKNNEGWTSTAIHDAKTKAIRRLSLKQCFAYPPTFCMSDIGPEEDCLCPNSGLWICRANLPQWEHIDEEGRLIFHWECKDAITRNEERKIYETKGLSEDWHAGLMMKSLGIKVYCTTEVRCTHYGMGAWDNHTPWGTAESEPGLT